MDELQGRSPISPRLVAGGISFAGWVLGFVSEFAGIAGLTTYAVVLTLLGASALWVSYRQPLVGRWFTLGVAVAGVAMGYHWLGVGGFLLLLPVVVALSYGMVGRGAALLVAGLQTALILFLPVAGGPLSPGGVRAFALGAIWLGVLVNSPVYERSALLAAPSSASFSVSWRRSVCRHWPQCASSTSCGHGTTTWAP
jgi:hypothetical protein